MFQLINQSQKYCLRAKTATEKEANGAIQISVKKTIDGGYAQVGQEGDYIYNKGQVVVDACYDSVWGVKVRGPSQNAWIGNIEFSTDDGNTWIPLYLENSSVNGATNPVCLSKQSECGGFDVRCDGGRTCNLYVSSQKVST